MGGMNDITPASRAIVHRTRGHGHGPITRLMSPSDLGEYLKPFVFLDIFDMDLRGPAGPRMPIHPHSGIATVTVLTQGRMNFEDPDAGAGTLGYGAVEWMRAGSPVSAGEMAVFENGESPIALQNAGEQDAVFVLGSAVPHRHELHLGNYSVHTTAQALAAGEGRIAELRRKMVAAGDRRTGSGTVPVYR
jgi:hypothetical protein